MLPRASHGTPAALRGLVTRYRGYVVLVLGSGATRLLALVTAVLLARDLGPHRFGEMSVFLTILTFWVPGDFIDTTYVRYASGAEDRATRDRYLRAAFVLKIAWNAFLLLIALPLAWTLSHAAFHKPVLLSAIFLALVCAVGLNFLSLRAATYQAQERFTRFTATTSLFYIGTFVVVALLSVAAARHDPLSYYVVFVVAATALGASSVVYVVRSVKTVAADRQVVKTLAHFSRWLFGAYVSYMLAQRLDLFLLAAFASLGTVGQYGAAIRAVSVVSLLTGTLAPVLLPRAARTRQSPELIRDYLRYAAIFPAVIAIVVAALWLSAGLVVKTLFGPAYSDAAGLVRILLLATLCVAVYTPLSQLFMAERDPRKMLYLSVLRLSCTLGVGFVLISGGKAEGAALTVVATEVLALCFVTLSLRRQLVGAARARAGGKRVVALPGPSNRLQESELDRIGVRR
jgi:O-antigen/teichoic acid export membrane protein